MTLHFAYKVPNSWMDQWNLAWR